MAEEVYKNEAKTVEQLEKEIAGLKEELAALQAKEEQAAETDAQRAEKAMEASQADKDVKVEMLCRWAAARAGAIVIAPLVGTVALMANEVYLISRIARVYDVKLTERALIAFLGAMGSRVAGSILTTIIPFTAIQVPVAVGITYSLGRVTQRWLKDGMPTDMGPYVEMMGQWKDKAREQVDKLKENPLKNVPLGDETIDYMKKWGNTAKDRLQDVREKGEEIYHNVRHPGDILDDIAEEKETQETVATTAAPEAAKAPEAATETTEATETAAATETTAASDTTPVDTASVETEQTVENTDVNAETAAETPAPQTASLHAGVQPTVEDNVQAALEDAKKPLDAE